MALEFAQNEYANRKVSGITIFSDSQSAVGILTLGWAATSHKQSVQNIHVLISDLKKMGIQVNIKWTPGHADIRGNSIADELAKEAAEEAEKYPEDTQLLTISDFKKYAKLTCVMKWQRRWDVTETGRHLYNFKRKVSLKLPQYMFMPFISEKKVISQLRLGYSLNEYRFKLGLEDTPNCSCGEIETVEHFICECELQELERQRLITQMFVQTGLQSISAETFLSLNEEDKVFKEHRESLLALLSDFITSAKRFLKN